MKRPTCSEEGIYDYTKLMNYIEWVYDIEVRNYKEHELFKVFREEQQLPRLIDPYIFLETYKEKMVYKEEKEHYIAAYRIQKEAYLEWKKERKQFNPTYRNFWHWILKEYGIENGGTIIFTLKNHLEDKHIPDWIRTILHFIHAEFPEKTLRLCTEW